MPSESSSSTNSVNKRKKKKSKSLLQIYDHFLPNDLAQLSQKNFFIFVRPDGERCLLFTGNGKTQVKNLKGNLVIDPFQSTLPGGSSPSEQKMSCILDVIFCKSLNIFFIVDCLKWGEAEIADCPLSQRLILLNSWLKDVAPCPELRLVKYLPLTEENLMSCYCGPLFPYLGNQGALTADLNNS